MPENKRAPGKEINEVYKNRIQKRPFLTLAQISKSVPVYDYNEHTDKIR